MFLYFYISYVHCIFIFFLFLLLMLYLFISVINNKRNYKIIYKLIRNKIYLSIDDI